MTRPSQDAETRAARYLLFAHHGIRYGVEVGHVCEIVWLPELTPAEEMPWHVVGVVNVRGRVVPVMDLDRRFGHPVRPYRPSDLVVLFETSGTRFGVIVTTVDDVVVIANTAVDPPPMVEDAPEHARFVAANARLDAGIVMLLDVEALLHAHAAAPTGEGQADVDGYFCPAASADERERYHVRALDLQNAPADVGTAERATLAVVQLGREYFGVEPESVREFAHLGRVTPIPCCPPHVMGNMNLRGDVLTLVDIRGLLHLDRGATPREVMVVQADGIGVGVPVDRVFEVIYVDVAAIASMPAASHQDVHEYCKGVVRYGDHMVSILDLHKILREGGLEVEQDA